MRLSLHVEDEALLQQSELVKMYRPSRKAHALVREWMEESYLGNVRLVGEDSQIWSETTPSELLALDRRDCDDPLSSWMTTFVTSWFHRAVGKYFKV
jgi:hypothetical protein